MRSKQISQGKTNSTINNILDLSDVDAKRITDYLSSKDKVLAKVIQKVGPFYAEKNTDASTFDALIRSIVYQQLNGKAAASIYRKFKLLFKDNDSSNPKEIMRLDDDTLRGSGLSRPKLRAIRSLCEYQINGLIPGESEIQLMGDDEIIETLIQVKGIGVWTAQMILMFHLGRPNILPVLDYGVRKGFQLTFTKATVELPDKAKLIGRAKSGYPTDR